MLGRRQINVQKENLAAMCRNSGPAITIKHQTTNYHSIDDSNNPISVKSLLDYACLYTHVDDDCEEFINFCAVFEQLVSHRLRPYQKKVWMPGQGSPRHFWDVLLESYNKTRGFPLQSCIPNIEAIEAFKSPKAKLRAFIRVALMEKRLSDYMFWLLDNSSLISESYLDGAILSSEEASVLCGDLIGLNAIDFNFCLKGNENELLGPLEISYSPFLKYKQTLASQYSDDIEMLRLSGKDVEDDLQSGSSIMTDSNINDILRLQSLEKNVNHMKEQKDYLEERVRLQERQIKDANAKMEGMRADHKLAQREWEQECSSMDACILELQVELGKMQKQSETLKAQVVSLKQFKQRMEMTDVPLVDMAEDREADRFVQMEQIDDRFNPSRTGRKKKPNHIPSDQRSIVSLLSDQMSLQEDSQSMVPLAGSLADVSLSAMDSETKEHGKAVLTPKAQDNLTGETSSKGQNNQLFGNKNKEESCKDKTKEGQDTQNRDGGATLMMVQEESSTEVQESLKSDTSATLLESTGRSLNNNSELETAEEQSGTGAGVMITAGLESDGQKDQGAMDNLKQGDNSELDIANSDSYVVMEEVGSEAMAVEALDNSEGGVMVGDTKVMAGENDGSVAFEDNGCGRDEEAVMSEMVIPSNASSGSSEGGMSEPDMVIPSNAGSSEGGMSEPEMVIPSNASSGSSEGGMSEPEMVIPSNASSGSSEGAWEMLSDSEQGDVRGGENSS